MNIKKKIVLYLITVLIVLNTSTIFAETTDELVKPEITAKSYILLDKNTGRILLAENENEKMYPASLTKLLTALVAVEYIKPDEIILVGNEINNVPWDSSIAGNKVGESILFENLLRGLLIPSGNDSATVIAMNVARRYKNNEDISYDEAMKVFADLMNEKAKELGATNSHFVTAHGYHDDNHYTTAYDISLIAMEALKNDLIAEICSEKYFEGNGAGDKRTVDMVTVDYAWDNTNLLLGGRLSTSDYYYKYATGVKTGSTTEAGNCLISSAVNDDESLIAVIMNAESPNNWYDSKKLLDYGFNNYSNVTIQSKNKEIKEVFIDKPRLGEDKVLSLITTSDLTVLLTDKEAESIATDIEINPDLKSSKQDETGTTLSSGITKGDVIGTVSYSLNGETLYSDNIVASRDVLKRTILSNLSYFGSVIKSIVCSWLVIPLIIFLALVTIFGIRAINIYKIKKKRKKRSQKYRFKSKY